MEKRNSHTLHVYCWKNIEPFIKYVCPPHCKDHAPNTQNNQKNPPQIPKKQILKKGLESEQASWFKIWETLKDKWPVFFNK